MAREVIGHLSFGIYKNFARAIRELVSNAYDAGATEVKIGLDLRSKTPKVIVRDDGKGMSINDMRKKLFRIGTVTPPTDEIDEETGRKKIGQFGIGFLSTFPYCDLLTVATKKRGEDTIVEVNVETGRFFKGDTFDITEQKVAYKKYRSDLPTEKGETIVTLEKIKPHIVNELKREHAGRPDTSIDRFEGFNKFKWSICQFAPIQYPPNQKDLLDFFTYEGRNPLRLWLDGKELFRNIPLGAEILEKGEEKFGDIRVKYVTMSPMRPVQPQEARGLQVRVRDVGIGLPTDFDVVKLKGRVLGKLNHICGEIHIIEGLVPIMIDRDSLSYTESVAKMQDFFRDRLTKLNGKLENWASEDKQIYSVLENVSDSKKIVSRLQSAGLIRYKKERLRLPKKKIALLSERLPQVMQERAQERGFEIKVEEKPSIRLPPIEVLSRERVLIIRTGHPSLKERITILGKSFDVSSDEWGYTDSVRSACKIEGHKAVFNTAHPIFDLKGLDEETTRRLVLGINLMMDEQQGKKAILTAFYQLLKELF